jgi:hypothetical protein
MLFPPEYHLGSGREQSEGPPNFASQHLVPGGSGARPTPVRPWADGQHARQMKLHLCRRPIVAVVGVALICSACGSAAHTHATTAGGSSGQIAVTYAILAYTDDGAAVELDNGSIWAVSKDDQSVLTQHWNLDSETVSIGDGGHLLVDVEGGGAHSVTATQIGTWKTQNVYPHPGAKTLSGVGHGAYFAGGQDGSLATLTDGSVWWVNNPNDQQTVSDWADGDNVVVRRIATSRLYTLDDTDVGSRVTAAYVGT